MADALSLNANVFLRSLIKAVGVCIFMFKISWRLSMVTVIGLPLVMIVSELYGQFLRSITSKVQDALAKVNEVAEEACSSIKTVRSFAGEDSEVNRYSERLKTVYSLNIRNSFAYAGYIWSTQFVSLAFLVATLFYGGHLVMKNLMDGGDLVSFLLYQIQLAFCFESIGSVYSGLMQAVGASEKVFEIIDRQPQIKNDGHLVPASIKGKLEFRNVSFKYPSRSDTLALKSVSLTIEPGEVVALVGPSGGGKSTTISLIEHFYEPAEGLVLLDGHPVQNYNHKYLHSKIALVSQEPVLFGRSIEENIAYGLPTWSKDDITKAAEMANAHHFISEMTKQYDTEAGEKGTQLSGGQKQRVAIARAIIRNPSILILDEATSALDAESEFAVQEAIEKNLRNRTVIIIAHRLSTVERADRIIVIDHGSVVEQGSHAQLLQMKGLYSQLVKRQLLGLDSIDNFVAPALKTSQDKQSDASTENHVMVHTIQSDINYLDALSSSPSRYGSPSRHGSPGKTSQSSLC